MRNANCNCKSKEQRGGKEKKRENIDGKTRHKTKITIWIRKKPNFKREVGEICRKKRWENTRKILDHSLKFEKFVSDKISDYLSLRLNLNQHLYLLIRFYLICWCHIDVDDDDTKNNVAKKELFLIVSSSWLERRLLRNWLWHIAFRSADDVYLHCGLISKDARFSFNFR